MSECPDCLQAQTKPYWGIYRATCEGCTVRGLAISPKHSRQRVYDMTLREHGQEALQELKAKVSEEWRRIQALKAQQEQ